MKVTSKMKSKCVNSVIEFMKTNLDATKNEIIEGALLIYGLTPNEIAQTSPRSKGGLLRSYMSTAFNNLLTKKDIERIERLRFNKGRACNRYRGAMRSSNH
jgi:hypothetical protein